MNGQAAQASLAMPQFPYLLPLYQESAANSREDSSRKECCLAMLFLAQMAGTLAESGPASQERDASGFQLPFPSAPQSLQIHKTEWMPLELVPCWLMFSTGL